MENKKILTLDEIEKNGEKTLYSRRDMLKQGGKVAAGLAGLGLVSSLALGCKEDEADAANTGGTRSEPANWGYTKISAADKATAQAASLAIYRTDFCATAVAEGIFDLLRASDGAPWTSFPKAGLRAFHGGVTGWGTACGTILAGAFIISAVVSKHNEGTGTTSATANAEAEAMINALFDFYANTPLPVYGATNTYTNPDDGKVTTIKQSTGGSPLCHVSVSTWMGTQLVDFGNDARKERCGRLAADVAGKVIDLLNDWKDGTVPTTKAPVFNNFDDIGRPTPMYTCSSCHSTKTDVTPN